MWDINFIAYVNTSEVVFDIANNCLTVIFGLRGVYTSHVINSQKMLQAANVHELKENALVRLLYKIGFNPFSFCAKFSDEVNWLRLIY